jgi:hypothetical protein
MLHPRAAAPAGTRASSGWRVVCLETRPGREDQTVCRKHSHGAG